MNNFLRSLSGELGIFVKNFVDFPKMFSEDFLKLEGGGVGIVGLLNIYKRRALVRKFVTES